MEAFKKPDSITIKFKDNIEKQLKYLGEGSFLEKEHLQKLPRWISVVTHFFRWLKPSCVNYYKGIMMSLPT